MVYCIADIHGNCAAYRRMLQKLALGERDTLYVLGDVVDRGPQGVEILRDMMARPNVAPILGNHEYMAAYCLRLLSSEVTEASIRALQGEGIAALADWFSNGGRPTLEGFVRLSPGERRDILDYLGEFTLYEEVRAGGQDYLLVHAGIHGFSPDRPLEDYPPHSFLLDRPDYGRMYWPDRYVVSGHTPTRLIPGNPRPDRIYRANRHIAIDCGCGFGGALGAVCLDTGEEYYV